jgi:AbrB family looped-hinge helix DNA binding protein
MPVSKLGQRRQVVIPKEIWDSLDLVVGDFVEVEQVKGSIVLKPKKLVDADDVLTPEEEGPGTERGGGASYRGVRYLRTTRT